MSVCGQNGQTEEDSASEEVGAVRDKTSDIYKQKPASKVVRVLTVLAYLLSVSLAAILLSVYYICVWKSPELPLNEPAHLSAPIDFRYVEQADQPFHINGGGDTAVNGTTTHTPLENITSGFTKVNVSELITETNEITVPPDPTSATRGLYNDTSDDISLFNETDSIT